MYRGRLTCRGVFGNAPFEWEEHMQEKKISCRGLRKILRRFDADGHHVQGRHWSVAKGGYDLWWQLYYDDVPVADCVCGELYNDCLPEAVFKKIADIIIQEYPDVQIQKS